VPGLVGWRPALLTLHWLSPGLTLGANASAGLQMMCTQGALVEQLLPEGPSGSVSSADSLTRLASTISRALVDCLKSGSKKPARLCSAVVDVAMQPHLWVFDAQRQPILEQLHASCLPAPSAAGCAPGQALPRQPQQQQGGGLDKPAQQAQPPAQREQAPAGGVPGPLRWWLQQMLHLGSSNARVMLPLALRFCSFMAAAPQLLDWYSQELVTLATWGCDASATADAKAGCMSPRLLPCSPAVLLLVSCLGPLVPVSLTVQAPVR